MDAESVPLALAFSILEMKAAFNIFILTMNQITMYNI